MIGQSERRIWTAENLDSDNVVEPVISYPLALKLDTYGGLHVERRYAEGHGEGAAEIRKRSGLLPVTVAGGVAWVCAQTAPNHLRLTLVDSGTLNPSDKTATASRANRWPLRCLRRSGLQR